jgi:hypothetical protein
MWDTIWKFSEIRGRIDSIEGSSPVVPDILSASCLEFRLLKTSSGLWKR